MANVNIQKLNQDWITWEEISSLKSALSSLDNKLTGHDYVKSLNEKLDTWLNKNLMDGLLKWLQNLDISKISLEQKTAAMDIIMILWKYDKEHPEVNFDVNIYKHLMLKFGGAENIWLLQENLNTAEQKYKIIQWFSKEICEEYEKLMLISGSWNTWYKDLDDYFNNKFEEFKTQTIYWIQTKYISELTQESSDLLTQINKDLFVKPNDLWLTSKQKRELNKIKDNDKHAIFKYNLSTLNDYVKTIWGNYIKEFDILKKLQDKQLNALNTVWTIATITNVEKSEVPETIDYNRVRSDANKFIENIREEIPKMHILAQSKVENWLNDFFIKMQTKTDGELIWFLRSWLENFQNQIKNAPINIKWNSNIEGVLNDAIAKVNSFKNWWWSENSPEQQFNPNQWKNILEWTNQNNLNKYFESEEYRDAYNQAFDLMYKDDPSLNENHKNKFYTILKNCYDEYDKTVKNQEDKVNFNLEHLQGETDNKKNVEFLYVDKHSVSANSKEDLTLHLYPEGTRIIKIFVRYENESEKKEPYYEYFVFWEQFTMDQTLVRGLKENQEDIKDAMKDDKSIWNLFVPITDQSEGWDKEFKQFKYQLQIAAYGWPEALSVFFDYQESWKKPFIEYLQQWENLKTVLNSFDKAASSQQEWHYFVKMFEWIKWDSILLEKYLWLLNSDGWDKYLGPSSELMARKTILDWLLSLDVLKTQGNRELFLSLTSKRVVLENALRLDTEQWKKSLVEHAKTYISVLFSHPIGQMIIGLLDSVLWGKWWLMKYLWGENSWFGKELNKQFKDQYALGKDQLEILNNIAKIGPANSFDMKDPQKYQTGLNDFIKNHIEKESDKNCVKTIVDQFYWDNWVNLENTKNLDVNLIERYFKANKEKKFNTINYLDIFEIKENKLSIKSGADVSPILQEILKDKDHIARILDANNKIITEKWLFGKDVSHKAISSDRDYMVFATAYLMWWSKWQWNFHYVISESDIFLSESALDQQNESIKTIQDQAQEQYNKKIKNVWNKLKENTKDSKYHDIDMGKYSFSKDTNKYQEDILLPMSDLFIWKTTIWKESFDNFNLLLKKHVSETITKEDILHYKNMFEYMSKADGFKEKIVLWSGVLNNMENITKAKVDNNVLVLSDADTEPSNKIKISFENDVLKVEYVAKVII